MFVLWFVSFPNHLTQKATFQNPYFYSIQLLSNTNLCITPICYMILYTRSRKINWLSLFCMESTTNSSNTSNITISRTKSAKSDDNLTSFQSSQPSLRINLISQSLYGSNDLIRYTVGTDDELLDLIQRGNSSPTDQNIASIHYYHYINIVLTICITTSFFYYR